MPALRLGLIGLLLLAALTTRIARAQPALTPSSTEDPSCPFNSSQRLDTTAPVDADNDLTPVGGNTTCASGTHTILSGTPVNTTGAVSRTSGSKDAAVVTLPAPGSGTVAVSGVDGATGEALVEFHDLP